MTLRLRCVSATFLFFLLILGPSHAWVTPRSSFSLSIKPLSRLSSFFSFSPVTPSLSASSSSDHHGDSSQNAAAPLPLTASDISRLADIRPRHVALPIMILDAMVPGQRLEFASPDPKFHRLLRHSNHGDNLNREIGMIGLKPHTGRPLNLGVTLPLTPDRVKQNQSTSSNSVSMLSMQVQAQRRFEVQGEPWLDETKSFYLANVELVEGRPEPPLSNERYAQALDMNERIPGLVEEWLRWVLSTGKSTPAGMSSRMQDIGPMPDEMDKRALWVAALVNPLPALGVCLEVRPAMLACRNDFDRIYLASAALQSSVNHMSGKRRLF